MTIRDQKNFMSGLLFVFIGLGCAGLSLTYTLGTPMRMGSGFFPLCLGLILTFLGVLLIVPAMSSSAERNQLESWSLRPFIIVLGSIVIFAVLLSKLGLIIAVGGLVLTSSFAAYNYRIPTILISVFVLSFICYIVFIYLLGLPIPAWPKLA